MTQRHRARLGEVQETLLLPLAARAAETAKARPILRDPKAAEVLAGIDYDEQKYGPGAGALISVLRTGILDVWVRAFLAEHPGGTVVEIGTGLNSRFERVDNGSVHWFDLDLADTIELRRRFFTDTERRRMLVASVLADDWFDTVAASPGPYFFAIEGVLVYLPPGEVTAALARIARRFPGSTIAFDTYTQQAMDNQLRMAKMRGIPARWQWACDDPRSLKSLGLRVLRSTTAASPPRELPVPLTQRLSLAVLTPRLRRMFRITEFRAVAG